jgi:hypothetical protein
MYMSKKQITSFLIIIVILVLGYLFFRKNTPQVSVSTSNASGLSVLSQNDLQFAGGFLIPDQCGGQINGITVRYVNGIRHILTRPGYGCGQSLEGTVFDYLDPGQAAYRMTYPYNVALNPSWGNNWGIVGKDWTLPNLSAPSPSGNPCNQCAGMGLFWDEQGQKLYTNYANLYTLSTPDPSVVVSTLNDATHTGTDVGCFGFQGQGPNRTSHGVAALPPWFVTDYLSAGERLAAGFGGAWESVNGSDNSHGPSLTSFVPPTNLSGCPTTTVNWLPHHLILDYPYNSTTSIFPSGAPIPARMLGFGFARDGGSTGQGWDSINGHGFHISMDGIGQGCVPVWSDAVQGFFCMIEKADGKFDATVLANPAPTAHSARLSTVTLADGSFLKKGDGIEFQIGPLGGQNCNGTSIDILVDTVDTNTNDITWGIESTGPITTNGIPMVGGFVKGSASHYCHAYPGPMRVWDVFQVYDMKDLGRVIQGTLAANAPNPTAEWTPSFPSPIRPNPRCGANGAGACANDYGSVGVAFDPIANQIIVAVRNVDDSVWAQHRPGIFVYNVRTGSGFPTLPPPGPGPTPNPTPSPTPTPSPSPSPTPVTPGTCVRTTTVTDGNGDVWTIGTNQATLKNGVRAGNGSGSVYTIYSNSVYVLGTDNNWYKWLGSGWQLFGVSEPNCPATTPAPAPVTPPTVVGDLNNDGIVNSLDWSYMNSKWFTSDATADLNHDGIVNSIDFSILNNNWQKGS